MCQYEDEIQPYFQATKVLYKKLLAVRKHEEVGDLPPRAVPRAGAELCSSVLVDHLLAGRPPPTLLIAIVDTSFQRAPSQSRPRAQTGKVEVVTRVFALRSVKAGKADPALFPTRSPCVMSHDDGHGQGAPPCRGPPGSSLTSLPPSLPPWRCAALRCRGWRGSVWGLHGAAAALTH
jgi:hypothetical protein